MVAVSLGQSECEARDNRLATFDGFPGFYCEGKSGKVAVFAKDHEDAVLIGNSLARCGYVPNHTGLADPKAACFGAIICHREDEDMTALYLLRQFKARRVVVVSDNQRERTVVSLLNGGAHHYFDFNDSESVLTTRLDAALRVHVPKIRRFLSIDDISFDTQKRTVHRADALIDLSPKEYELALYLFSHMDRVIGNGELMNAVWSLPSDMDSRRIDTAACRVRKKLGLTPVRGWELKRIRMVGYRLIQSETAACDSPVTAVLC